MTWMRSLTILLRTPHQGQKRFTGMLLQPLWYWKNFHWLDILFLKCWILR